MPALAAVLAMCLSLPALRPGFFADDYFHRVALTGEGVLSRIIHGPGKMFFFFSGDPAQTLAAMELGVLPWYTDPHIKAALWRPLTVLTHWLDYRLWPDSPTPMHLHSILWLGAAVFVVGLLYRQLMTPAWLAGLAMLLYAVDDAHGMPVGFLANRNVLICVVFGVCAVLCHDRWRRTDWRAGAVLAPVCLAASLLAKEAGVAAAGYLAAYALCLDRAPPRKRLATLAPYVAVVILWRIAWNASGAGFAHAGLYVDPLTEPLRYAAAFIERAPLLLLGQWVLPPAEASMLLDETETRWLWAGALLFLAILLLALLPLLRHGARARFWAVGMVLALLPASAALPADRLLMFVGIGGTALLASLLRGIFGHPQWRPHHKLWRSALPLGVLLVVIHGAVSPVALALRTAYPSGPPATEALHFREPLDAAITDQDLVLLNPPSILHIAYLLPERELASLPLPRRVRPLAPGFDPLTIHRPDAHTLIIRPDHGFMAWMFESLLRRSDRALGLGDVVSLNGLDVTVTALSSDGRPAEAAFRFDVPLESNVLRWYAWRNGGFEPFSPPPIGATIRLEPGPLALW